MAAQTLYHKKRQRKRHTVVCLHRCVPFVIDWIVSCRFFLQDNQAIPYKSLLIEPPAPRAVPFHRAHILNTATGHTTKAQQSLFVSSPHPRVNLESEGSSFHLRCSDNTNVIAVFFYSSAPKDSPYLFCKNRPTE